LPLADWGLIAPRQFRPAPSSPAPLLAGPLLARPRCSPARSPGAVVARPRCFAGPLLARPAARPAPSPGAVVAGPAARRRTSVKFASSRSLGEQNRNPTHDRRRSVRQARTIEGFSS